MGNNKLNFCPYETDISTKKFKSIDFIQNFLMSVPMFQKWNKMCVPLFHFQVYFKFSNLSFALFNNSV